MNPRDQGPWCRHGHRHLHDHVHRGSRRFFWRVYLHGMLLLLGVGIAVALVGASVGGAPAWRRFPERLATFLADRYAAVAHEPAQLQHELGRARELLGVQVTLYGNDGALLASTVEPPFPPLPPADVRRVQSGPVHTWGFGGTSLAVPLQASGATVGYAVGALADSGPSIPRGIATVLAIIGALGLLSYPLARQVTRPLERLTGTVRAFGGGDLSARARLRRRDEVGELSQAFDEMADRIELLLRSEKELIANVSHELRTPLARIRVALELAAEGDGEKARGYLRDIGADLEELDRLVEDVLTAARLELASGRTGPAANPPLRRAPVAAAELVERAAERFRTRHPQRTLEVRLGGALPELDADATLLRRAIDNLLDNARKYSDADRPVVLAARAADGELEVEVQDRGIGIDAPDLERLFTPFFRTDRSRARGTGGVGLGLALARRIVEAHGGRISVESRAGEGTTVRFRVPARAAR